MTTISVVNLILILVVMAVIGYQHVKIRRLKNDVADLKDDQEWLIHEIQRLKRPGSKRLPPPRSLERLRAADRTVTARQIRADEDGGAHLLDDSGDKWTEGS